MIEILALIIVLAVATYLSALGLALHGYSPSALEKYYERKGRPQRGLWLTRTIDATVVAVSLVRVVFRVTFFVLVVALISPPAEDGLLLWTDLVIAGGVSVVGLWLSATVIARALARYAPLGIIAGSLPILRLLTLICGPLARSLNFIDESIRRLSGANLVNEQEVIEAELLQRIEDTHREGRIDEEAAMMLGNIVEFRTTDVGEVMTPRTDIDGIELTNDLEAVREFINEVGHSRIPVYSDNLDHLKGILYVKDLIPYLGRASTDFKLEPLLRQPLRVPETKPVSELLADFQRSEVHMAIVIDEYGGTAGLVTIEDILEEIVGEIHDEHEPEDEEEPTLTVIDETRSEVDGRFHIDDLNERLSLNLPEDEEFDTVAGFLMSRLGHVPKTGETLDLPEARFTAIQTTPTQVQRISVELISEPTPNGVDQTTESVSESQSAK